jgi:hypothetical protein
MNTRAIALAHFLRADPHPHPDYRVCHDIADIADYVTEHVIEAEDDWIVAEDTESLPDGSPYCLTFSVSPGTGRLIYARDLDLLKYWGDVLGGRMANCLAPHQLFHNYLHDVIPFTALSLPIHKFTDTMVRAYHLCLGGGGDEEDQESKAGRGSLSLKVLAYRHLNMQMTSFKDTVYPHSVPHLVDWLKNAAQGLAPLPKLKLCECGHEQGLHDARGKTQRHTGACCYCTCKKYKAAKLAKPTPDDKHYASLHTRTARLAAKLTTETLNWADSKHDPWKFIRTNWAEDVGVLELMAGGMPVPSVAHVPEPQLLNYACRDADATLRLFLHMRNLRPWVF